MLMLANFPVDTVNQHCEKVVGGVKAVEPTRDEVMYFNDVRIDGTIGVLNGGNIKRVRERADHMVGIYHAQNGGAVRYDPFIAALITNTDDTATFYEDAPFRDNVDGL